MPLGVGLVAILSLFAALDYWQITTRYNKAYPDVYRIGFQDARFREVVAAVPDDAVLGYISDADFATIRGSSAFFGAQYALTPRILVPYKSPHARDLILGNYSKKVDPAQVARKRGFELLKDFGAGVILFRKGKAK